MRIIKFRGRRVDNGEWVYGDLIQLFGGRKYIIDNKFGACIDESGNFINTEYPFVNDVIPETVGQFTGLRDKNGTEVYAGDICNCREYECFGKVEWNDDEAGFFFCVVIESGGFEEERLYEYIEELEIIGNIYENKELLQN